MLEKILTEIPRPKVDQYDFENKVTFQRMESLQYKTYFHNTLAKSSANKREIMFFLMKRLSRLRALDEMK